MGQETDESLIKYKDELIVLLHKSQEAFEKQLSYISAGSLALSVGFIKDVIKDLPNSEWRICLNLGWALLAITLLVNLISHIRAADLHNRTISEIYRDGHLDHTVVKKRYREISKANWFSVGTLVFGIFSIIIFVIKNIYNES